MSAARILIAEDEEITRDNLVHVLTRQGHQATGVADGSQAIMALEREEFDLLLTDLRMGGVDGMEVLETAKTLQPECEVIILTGFATVQTAVEAMNKGAYNYLSKPYKLEELRALVGKALEKSSLKKQVEELKQICESPAPVIIGQSPSMRELRKRIEQVASVDSNVLIQGETGTGKELVARSIHYHSPRREKRFMAVNCAAFTEELLANELFGHEKEAFTGAHSRKKGLLEITNGGSFFLDEIGDMPLPMQAKLLRVLEERTLIRVGGSDEIPVDVRIIAATNKNLKVEAENGNFRPDLYYRLNVISLLMPPLAERMEDIPLLANHFLHRHAKIMGKEVTFIYEDAMRLLMDYEYPGNARELENIIESAIVICNSDRIEVGHLPPDLQQRRIRLSRDPGPVFNEFKTLREVEAQYIAWVLAQLDDNKSKAAEILGIDRSSIWRKLQQK